MFLSHSLNFSPSRHFCVVSMSTQPFNRGRKSKRKVLYENDADAADEVTFRNVTTIGKKGKLKKTRVKEALYGPPSTAVGLSGTLGYSAGRMQAEPAAGPVEPPESFHGNDSHSPPPASVPKTRKVNAACDKCL
jgi:hypothetical protein